MKSNIITMINPTGALIADRLLSPRDISLHCDLDGQMDCKLATGEVLHGATAELVFPTTHTNHFISLRYTDDKDKERCIGIIGGLATFPEDAVALVRASIARRYQELLAQLPMHQAWQQFFEENLPCAADNFAMA